MRRIDPPTVIRHGWWRGAARRIGTAVMTLLVGAAPLAILFALQQYTESRFGETTLQYLWTGTFIWAALCLLTAIDPGFSTKVATLKDIWGAVKGGDKKD